MDTYDECIIVFSQQSNFLWINRTQAKKKDTQVFSRAESNCLIPLPECK